MLAAAETLPDHPRHAQRLAKAARCFQKARLVGQALYAREAMILAHPKDPLVRDALFDVAAAFHQLAYYSKAAACYEAFAMSFPSDKRAVRALENVKEFTKAVNGDPEDCIRTLDLSLIGEGSHSVDRRRRTGEVVRSQSVAPATAVAQDAGLAQTGMLTWLRKELDRLHRSRSGEYDSTQDWQEHDVSVLAGMSRNAVLISLGTPDVCGIADGRSCPFGAGRIAYAFFRLAGRMGGGPNLVLRFDDRSSCTDARWILWK